VKIDRRRYTSAHVSTWRAKICGVITVN